MNLEAAKEPQTRSGKFHFVPNRESPRRIFVSLFRRLRLIGAVLAIGGVFASPPDLEAHPGHSPAQSNTTASLVRNWNDVVHNVRIQGCFVALKGDQVQIRRTDETLAQVRIADLAEDDQDWIFHRVEFIRLLNERLEHRPLVISAAQELEQPDEEELTMKDLIAAHQLPLLLAQIDPAKPGTKNGNADQTPEMAKAFEAFVKTKAIKTRWDQNYFYVESNGIPDHRMMVGITAWQQQVPLPQAYTGENSWRIPLKPKPAKLPQSTKRNFLRGAIAIAVNGVPIFNPLNNRGDDAFLFGELDEFGGHCGRADDYHYHLAPVHLSKIVGKGLPIAYALDGYPIYGYEEPDGSKVKGLDEFNGHKDSAGNYHYHATKKYPYLNGGFHGEVTERHGQVDPQPHTEPVRPDTKPLRGAKVLDFVETKPGSYQLTYANQGLRGTVSYETTRDGSVKFSFVDPNGSTRTETYQLARREPEKQPAPPPQEPQPPPVRNEPPPQNATSSGVTKIKRRRAPVLEVTSSAVDGNGLLSPEFTCDGAGISPPLEWKGGPEGTKCYAISVWHTAPDQEKSYWVVYDIPVTTTSIPRNDKKTGKVGMNDKQRAAYEPMCSRGPGLKLYHITVFALSAELNLAPEKVNRATLLESIKGTTLAEGTLDFQYERKR